MEKIVIEMPLVSQCDAKECGYNIGNNCHAKAITIGDYVNPGCDTYFNEKIHNKETKRVAGVGACKVDACKFNSDFECVADNIAIGMIKKNVTCLTFTVSEE